MRFAAAWLAALAMGGSAWADGQATMSRQDYRAAEARIEAQRERDDSACERLRKPERALCVLEAKGREKVARAELEARYRPSLDAERALKEAQAEADHALARARCKAGPEDRRERCMEQARHALEAAIRQAKVEKVERMEARARAEAQRKAASGT